MHRSLKSWFYVTTKFNHIGIPIVFLFALTSEYISSKCMWTLDAPDAVIVLSTAGLVPGNG
jgi:hypothetical protein